MAPALTPLLERSYLGRTVLVTGHTGVKGAWLVSWLTRLGARVVGYALPPEHGPLSLFESARVGRDMVSVMGDVRDLDAVRAVCRRHQPEVVFHLAAQSLVRRSYREPVLSYATNVLGTVHLLEAARETPTIRAVVVVTSDKCYENPEDHRAFRETDPVGGADPYSSSKGCAELVVAAYRRSFFGDEGAAVASARAGNVIAGGDWAEDRLVPDLMRAVAEGRTVTIRSPDAVRPWQHALDPLQGYLVLGARLLEAGAAYAEAWNFGPAEGEAVSVRELVRRIEGRWDRIRTAPLPGPAPDGPAEARYLQLDATKARERLGWTPRLGTDEAIDWTVEWYRRFLNDAGTAREVVVEQLSAYTQRMNPP